MSDSENTFNEDYDDASTMSVDTDNSSSDNSFKPSIKIGKATNIQLDNLEEDTSEYNDNESYINEEDDDTNSIPVAGDTDDDDDDDDDEGELDDEYDIYGDVNYPKPLEKDDDDEDDKDDMDYDRTPKTNIQVDDEDDDGEESDSDEDSEEDDDYLQKFDKEIINNYIVDYHPEAVAHNFDEVKTMANVVRNAEGIIVDDLHRTIPILTKFEKARVLGIRAKQLNDGAKPFIKTPPEIIDGYTIARMELGQKLMPFIIRRPLPNGGCEYWKIADLELI